VPGAREDDLALFIIFVELQKLFEDGKRPPIISSSQ
jgi:hypothetical protein